MRFALLTSTLAVLATSILAAENPIILPDSTSSLHAGEPFTITWTPTTSGPVKLYLRQGDPGNLKTLSTLVEDSTNSGSYEWQIPGDLPKGDNYAIMISNGDEDNYTPLIAIDSDVVAAAKPSASPKSEKKKEKEEKADNESVGNKGEVAPAHAMNATVTAVVGKNATASASAGPSKTMKSLPTVALRDEEESGARGARATGWGVMGVVGVVAAVVVVGV
ncbi:hypothetical protein EX30DRAFT_345013 [Ascodesmis nigricans]|uniref:Yeast cell wall synthesis Kre9/Knh1-like N-terminal domain-containing protein n=1 Tax=Ascodesmis nigricans TaxID=341454 RepID=A0A4V3SHH7_9PEZI|nr:hypothetical protein EX30DRAFT_345013 [Ascodesmis nigricans]